MKSFLTSILLLFTSAAFAQNYDCLQFGPKNYFINGNGYVRGIRIDSVRSSGSDIIYFPYRTSRIRTYLGGWPGEVFSIDTLGASWLGKNVVKKPDGTFIFDNMWDTVFIKTQAHTGDSWVFFDDTSDIRYTATVTSEDTMTVLGLPDSIKTITISSDSAGVPHTIDPVNNFRIVLSKNNGFVQIFDLFTFPFHRPDSFTFQPHYFYYIRHFDYYLDVVLGNLGTCDLGCSYDWAPDTVNSIFHLFPFHNPTTMEIYDFAPGDVYETIFTAGANPSIYIKYTLDSVLSKSSTPYSVTYGGTERTESMVQPPGAPPTDFVFNNPPFSLPGGDTTRLIPAGLMPEEWSAGFLLHYFEHDSGTDCAHPSTYVIDDDFRGGGFASDGFAMIPSARSSSYSIGLGRSGTYFYNSIGFQTQELSYSYYHKNSTDCGWFFHVGTSATQSVQANNRMMATPNPANQQLNITVGNTISNIVAISVYDFTGRQVFRSAQEIQNGFTIQTANWQEGLYIIVAQDNNGILLKDKIEIRH